MCVQIFHVVNTDVPAGVGSPLDTTSLHHFLNSSSSGYWSRRFHPARGASRQDHVFNTDVKMEATSLGCTSPEERRLCTMRWCGFLFCLINPLETGSEHVLNMLHCCWDDLWFWVWEWSWVFAWVEVQQSALRFTGFWTRKWTNQNCSRKTVP